MGPAWSGEVVTANLIGLVLAVGVAVYLVAALLFPERF
ncbi:K(+)-transporting ATPase subunit F [Nocardia asiatica]